MGKKRIVVDTNVLISAFGWEGRPRKLLEMIIEGKCEIVISDKQMHELKRVLDYPKFDFNSVQKSRLVNMIEEIAIMINVSGNTRIIREDPSDNIIIESAVISASDFIISGDNHILKLKKIAGVKTVSVTEFMDHTN